MTARPGNSIQKESHSSQFSAVLR